MSEDRFSEIAEILRDACDSLTLAKLALCKARLTRDQAYRLESIIDDLQIELEAIGSIE